MLLNYLLLAIRNFRKDSTFSFINTLGMAWGMAVFIFVVLYIQHERLYEQQWRDAQSIFRINQHLIFEKSSDHVAITNYPLADFLQTNFPQVKSATRHTWFIPQNIRSKHGIFHTNKMIYADSSFFSIFDFQFSEGSPASALADTLHCAISEDLAKNLFPETSAFGKTVVVGKDTLHISGVYQLNSRKSDLRPEIVRSLRKLIKNPDKDPDWLRIFVYTYVKLQSPEYTDSFRNALTQWADTAMPKWVQKKNIKIGIQYQAEPLPDVHFDNTHSYQFHEPAEASHLNYLLYVAISVLALSCINFVNLSAARNQKRIQEVGLRKVMGANNPQLIGQFLIEAVFISIISVVAALGIVDIGIFILNPILQTEVSFTMHRSLTTACISLLFIPLMSILVGIISGIIPAVKLTKPKVMNFLTPKFKLRTSGNIRTESSTIMRQFLVAIQFFTASLLAIFAWALWLQVHTLKTQTTAHNTEQIVLINSPETTSPDSPQAKLFADSLRSLPQSLLMTYTTGLPSQPHIRFMFYKHSDDTTQLPMNFTSVSSDFLNILNLKLISGQFFSKKQTTTNIKEFVVNRAAAELIGQNSLTDTLFTNFDLKGKIVGVIENFSYDDPNKAIEPMVYTLQSQRTREITLKLKPNTPIPYTEICKINQYFFPGYPLEIKPLISQMAKYYQKEETLFTFFLISATLAFIIAILGLFGLTSYIVSQHQKSISIRKMLGSSNTQIIQLLTAQILPWLLTFTLSTWPLSRIILGLWYQHADIRLPLYWYSTLGFPLLISLLATIIVSLYTGIAAHKKSKTITIYE